MKNIFKDSRQFYLVILGIYSGLPLGVLYTTISTWLKDESIDIAIITTFAISRVFYSLKVFWAPLVDHIKLPMLHKIGQRKSWMVLCSVVMSICFFSMSKINASQDIKDLYIIVIIFGLASATFDIAFDAFRIELLHKEEQSMGAANTIFGYRIGMTFIAGAGALYYAEYYSWPETFFALTIFYIAGIFYILSMREQKIAREKVSILSLNSWKVMTIDPFYDFFKRDYAFMILMAVILFKLGDAMLGVVANPFYLELGFSKSEIASITKIFGLCATLFGAYIGGYLMYRTGGSFKGMIIAGIIQALANGSFIYLNHMGHDLTALTITIAIENTASGISNVALVGYISSLCNKHFSATQYALLSSASGLVSHTIVVFGGSMVKALGWDLYFVTIILFALPGILILWYLNKITQNSPVVVLPVGKR